MTTNWEDIVGKFSQLSSNAMKNDIGKAFYMMVVRRKDIYVESSNDDSQPFKAYETLHQVLSPPGKDKEKYTYDGQKKVKDENGDYKMVDCKLPMKKFMTITADVKSTLIFLLNVYIKQVHDYFESNKRSFKSADSSASLMERLMTYSNNNHGPSISLILTVLSMQDMDLDLIFEGYYHNINIKIYEKAAIYFKNPEGQVQSEALNSIVGWWCKFAKFLAITASSSLFAKRVAVNKQFLFTILRTINDCLIVTRKSPINEELLDYLSNFIEDHRPPKKESTKKKKKSDDTLSEDEDEDEPKKTKSTKAAASKTTSKRGRPAAKAGKEEEENDDGSDDESTGEIEDAMGTNVEDWGDSADESEGDD